MTFLKGLSGEDTVSKHCRFFRVDKSNEWGKKGKEKNDSGNRTRVAPLTCQTFNHCATTADEVKGLKANQVSHQCGKVRERCSYSIFVLLPTFYCSLWTVVIVKLRKSLGRSFPLKKVIKKHGTVLTGSTIQEFLYRRTFYKRYSSQILTHLWQLRHLLLCYSSIQKPSLAVDHSARDLEQIYISNY